MNPGDRVLLVAGGRSVFEIVEIQDDRAIVRPVQDAPGAYPFSHPLEALERVL